MKDLLYLKDEQIKEFIQLLYYAYRETFSDPKEILSKKFDNNLDNIWLKKSEIGKIPIPTLFKKILN